MKLEFDNGTMHLENHAGLRWRVTNAVKPAFSFEYDALLVDGPRALRRLGGEIQPLGDAELAQIHAFVDMQVPPESVTLQGQFIADLRVFAHGLMNTVVAQLEYDGLLDVAITGRSDSTDLFREEARRVLAYVDSVWNAYHGLAARLAATDTSALRPFKDYAEMMPFPPSLDYFASGLHPGLFDATARPH